LRGESWWIDGRFPGAKNMPLDLNFLVENSERGKTTADPFGMTTRRANAKATTRQGRSTKQGQPQGLGNRKGGQPQGETTYRFFAMRGEAV
jgi:hypothetical protein